MPYLDTSLLVGALTRERRTPELQAWLAGQAPQSLVVSDWVVTEFSAALAMKVRQRQLGADERADVLAAFTRLMRETFTVVPVTRGDFREAARLMDASRVGLRAGGALTSESSRIMANGCCRSIVCRYRRRLRQVSVRGCFEAYQTV